MTRRESLGLGVAAMAGAAFPQKKKLRAVVIGHTGRGGYGHNWDMTFNGIDAVDKSVRNYPITGRSPIR